MVHCVKINRELPGLERPPMPGELGQRVFENVSQQAWQMWMEQVTILINHYGLNMADPSAQEFLNEQMEEFFFGVGAQMPEDWVPEGQGGKGGPAAKGGAPSKGAPAPQRK
jgi:Fe-S cluster biosynthesis and repair protein YggX